MSAPTSAKRASRAPAWHERNAARLVGEAVLDEEALFLRLDKAGTQQDLRCWDALRR